MDGSTFAFALLQGEEAVLISVAAAVDEALAASSSRIVAVAFVAGEARALLDGNTALGV